MGVRQRLRDAIEAALPWFDRAAEDRWKASMRIELRASRATRARADQVIGRHERMRQGWAQSMDDLPRRYGAYDDAVRGS